jgi:hypothetical protein
MVNLLLISSESFAVAKLPSCRWTKILRWATLIPLKRRSIELPWCSGRHSVVSECRFVQTWCCRRHSGWIADFQTVVRNSCFLSEPRAHLCSHPPWFFPPIATALILAARFARFFYQSIVALCRPTFKSGSLYANFRRNRWRRISWIAFM